MIWVGLQVFTAACLIATVVLLAYALWTMRQVRREREADSTLRLQARAAQIKAEMEPLYLDAQRRYDAAHGGHR